MSSASRRPSLGRAAGFLAAGVALLAVALLLTLTLPRADLPAFLAMILGGWAVGVAFVRATALLPRRGLVVHAIGAVASAAAVVLTTASVGQGGPGGRAVAYVLAMASLPAAAWIGLSLLSRILGLASRSTGRSPSTPGAPEWEADGPRGGARVRVRAVPLTMRGLTLALAATVAVAGAAATVLAISLSSLFSALGARFAIVVVGLVVALPVFVVVRAVLRSRSAAYAIAFTSAELRLDGPEGSERFPYDTIDRLRWRTESEYARVEVHAGATRRTLLVGQAPPPPGRTAALPPLSRRITRDLQEAGLVADPGHRGPVLTFRREADGIRSQAHRPDARGERR